MDLKIAAAARLLDATSVYLIALQAGEDLHLSESLLRDAWAKVERLMWLLEPKAGEAERWDNGLQHKPL